MKIYDVYSALATSIIRYTDVFSESIIAPTFVSVAGSILRLQSASPHGLSTIDFVGLPNRRTVNAISSVAQLSTKRYRVTTASDNDLTSDYVGRESVRFDGFVDVVWNGDLRLAKVYDRRTFDIAFDNPVAAPILTGDEVLLERREFGLFARSLLPVTAVISPTVFEVDLGVDYSGFNILPGDVVKKVRIAPMLNPAVAADNYTRHAQRKLWAFVVPQSRDAQLSKSRHATTDSLSEIGTNTGTPQIFNDGFDVLIFAPIADEKSGIRALDLCRHDLLLPMLKSLRGIKFDTGTTFSAQHTSTLVSHALEFSDSNEAYLVYRYSFEVPITFTNFDVNENVESLSFNSIVLNVDLENGTTFGSVNISLDAPPV